MPDIRCRFGFHKYNRIFRTDEIQSNEYCVIGGLLYKVSKMRCTRCGDEHDMCILMNEVIRFGSSQ